MNDSTPRNLLDLATIKTILGITDTLQDAKIIYASPIVTNLFEEYCARGLAYESSGEEFYTMTSRLPLWRFPIETVGGYEVDGVPQSTIPSFDKMRGFLFIGSNSNSLVKVTYAAGYPQDAVPPDLADSYAKCVADYGGVIYNSTGGSTGSSAPLKSLSLGSGALAVSFETAASASSSIYDVADAPTILHPYVFVLRKYRIKDYV